MAAPYPLKTWTLEGFRAIGDQTDFQLGGLNILVGANSAGKSSVLHSLLLAAQTLATPMADRPLVLNGPLVRLGLANDCVHEQTGNALTIAFSFCPSAIDLGRPVMEDVSQIDVRSKFVVAPDEANFNLAETKLVSHLRSDEPSRVHVRAFGRTQIESHETLVKEGADEGLANEYAGRIGIGVEGEIPEGAVGVYMRQFLPNTLAILINAYGAEVEDILRILRPRAGRLQLGVRARQTPLSEPVAVLLRRFVVETLGADEAIQLPSGTDLTPEALRRLPDRLLDGMRSKQPAVWFSEHTKELPFKGEVEGQMMVNILDASVDYVRWWFERRVFHLGPLRAAPQPLYGLPEAASGLSVGPNGEYTAAVLSTYGKRYAPVPMPDGAVRTVSLGAAVDQWMAKLGLLAAVKPRERGKYGYELNVEISGVDRPLDLTTVGVGVSQALPIVVLGLVSEPGALLLFEQPELHLHPDVQAELGDFFLALARSGRQLVVETHSEYLVNRLRRRQATDQDPDAADLTRLFFFERDGADAKVIPARIGQDGSMPDWPRGFLDTASRELEEMVRPHPK